MVFYSGTGISSSHPHELEPGYDEYLLDVFLCYSPADREVADRIQVRLIHGAEATVWLEPCGRGTGQTLAAAWDGGLSAAAIVLLLSPNSIPDRLPVEQWRPLLEHVDGNATPPVGVVLLEACPYPRLLERKRLFRWSGSGPGILRQIESWIVGLHDDGPPSFVPARLPWFEARHSELTAMWEMLVDGPGAVLVLNPEPRSGKTSLAQEFACAASGHFRDVVWIACGDRPADSIAWELRRFAPQHRVLLVLDDLTEDLPLQPANDRRASVLVTTRRADLNMPVEGQTIRTGYPAPPLPECPAPGGAERRLWDAMSACRPQSIPLNVAMRISGMEPGEAQDAAQRLVAQRLVDPLDAAGMHFRMAATPAGGAFRERHGQAIYEIFSQWRTQPENARTARAELEPALKWALASDWTLATRLANHAGAFLRAEERNPEAARIYAQLRQAARQRGDDEVAENCSWELSWLQTEEGEPRPAAVSGHQLAFAFG